MLTCIEITKFPERLRYRLFIMNNNGIVCWVSLRKNPVEDKNANMIIHGVGEDKNDIYLTAKGLKILTDYSENNVGIGKRVFVIIEETTCEILEVSENHESSINN